MKTLPILFALLWGTSSPGQAAHVVVPNELAGVEGNTAQLTPFTGPDAPPPGGFLYDSVRYQQVYEASQFAALGPGGEFVVSITIRIDSDVGEGFAAVLRDVQVNLSVTQKPADGLSTTFAENVGLNDTVVFPRGQLEFGWGFSPFERPQGFGGFIPDVWYFYRPSAGNLLLDIRVFTYSNSFRATFFDASSVAGDAISCVASTNVTSAVGQRFTQGLVTQFHTFPTPALSLTWTNGSLRFTWVDYPRGYRLETRDCLDCASAWQPVAERGTTNEYVREVLLPLETGAPAHFYRLCWTSPAKALTADKDAGEAIFNAAKNR